MKHLLFALLLVSFSSALADTPAKIAEDYRKQAAAALAKVNDTLEKATVPLIATLVKSGDTAGADELRDQLKSKTAGGPVAKPQASAANMFKLYDAARVKALVPAQNAAVGRIDAMLASSEGQKLEVVTELSKTRAEIEAGKVGANAESTAEMPGKWSYHMKSDIGPSGSMVFKKNGDMEQWINGRNQPAMGTWKKTKTPGLFTLTLGGDTFPMVVTGDTAELDMPNVGKRYLKVLPQQPK